MISESNLAETQLEDVLLEIEKLQAETGRRLSIMPTKMYIRRYPEDTDASYSLRVSVARRLLRDYDCS